jgi:hypothetical protein
MLLALTVSLVSLTETCCRWSTAWWPRVFAGTPSHRSVYSTSRAKMTIIVDFLFLRARPSSSMSGLSAPWWNARSSALNGFEQESLTRRRYVSQSSHFQSVAVLG